MSGKRERVVEAASALFFEYGIADTGMERIAEQASVSKMTLYNYFQNKEGLLREVTSRLVQKAEEDIDRVLSEESEPFSALLRLRDEAAYASISDVFIRDLIEDYPDLAAELMEFQTKGMAAKMEQLIFRSQQSGMLRKDVSPHVLFVFTMAVKEYLSRPGVWDNMPDIRAASEQILSMMYSGILSEEYRREGKGLNSAESETPEEEE
ncbi:TetR/AcrR family transcriptional regulator [Saccharibacillus kuerlensis]|uniref:TetR family transcriptional regulator n=1 Tax=Saccharibacillus kuerlensis TaxID=459527 RepID=A0ABQ2LB19_9BACL|nr:TetR/AcrR family transcriptional regulator [Saccharibacillus kuerlensis]GGO08921.1 TetR family transcriptional regulator [Saccharibacillus kuerlensis]